MPEEQHGQLLGSVPDQAVAIFGEHLPQALRYVRLLVTDGVTRGLIGPRETPIIWQRHVLNCAALAELIPGGARVADVGSGAGLPGIVLAILRPDLRMTLIEPLARRTVFLSEVVTALGLDSVRVLRARAEQCAEGASGFVEYPADFVTVRAVAALDRIAEWCLPLLRPGGQILAVKGALADDEVQRYAGAVARLGGSNLAIRRCGLGLLEEPTTVVVVDRAHQVENSHRRGYSAQRYRRSLR